MDGKNNNNHSAPSGASYLDSRFNRVRIRATSSVSIAALIGTPQCKRSKSTRAVVLVHGFAAEKTENGLFLQVAEQLLDSGLVVLMYDWRGLEESSGNFAKTKLTTHVADFQRVVEWLQRTHSIDAAEVCAVGFSLGAAVVAMSIMKGTKLASASYWSPAIRPAKSMWPRYDTDDTRRQLQERGYVEKPENSVLLGKPILASLRDTDLGSCAFNVDIPLLVCHGTNDSRIPFETTFRAYKETSNPNALFARFDGASHSFQSNDESRQDLKQLFVKWLTGELQPDDSSTLKTVHFLDHPKSSRNLTHTSQSIDSQVATQH